MLCVRPTIYCSALSFHHQETYLNDTNALSPRQNYCDNSTFDTLPERSPNGVTHMDRLSMKKFKFQGTVDVFVQCKIRACAQQPCGVCTGTGDPRRGLATVLLGTGTINGNCTGGTIHKKSHDMTIHNVLFYRCRRTQGGLSVQFSSSQSPAVAARVPAESPERWTLMDDMISLVSGERDELCSDSSSFLGTSQVDLSPVEGEMFAPPVSIRLGSRDASALVFPDVVRGGVSPIPPKPSDKTKSATKIAIPSALTIQGLSHNWALTNQIEVAAALSQTLLLEPEDSLRITSISPLRRQLQGTGRYNSRSGVEIKFTILLADSARAQSTTASWGGNGPIRIPPKGFQEVSKRVMV